MPPSPTSPPGSNPPWPGRIVWTLASIVVAGTALWWQVRAALDMRVPGWDEASHSMRGIAMARALFDFDFERWIHLFHGSDFYPPLARFGMGLGAIALGPTFASTRIATAFAWIAGIWLACGIVKYMVPRERAPMAFTAALVLALSAWVPVYYGRMAYLESWCLLAMAGAARTYLYFTEKPSAARAVAAGAATAAVMLVKYNYGVMALFAVLCAAAAGWVVDRRPPFPLRCGVLFAVACAAPLVYWFVFPWPAKAEVAAAHRESVMGFLGSSTELRGLDAADLIYLIPYAVCGSLVSFMIQSAGVVSGLLHYKNGACRLCVLVVAGGLAAWLTYPYRLDRFLQPTLFPLWPLAGAVLATAVFRAGGRLTLHRPAAPAVAAAILMLATLALSVITTGMGSWTLVSRVLRARGSGIDRVDRTVRRYQHMYLNDGGVPGPPDESLNILQFARDNIDPGRGFLWIGGNDGEVNVALVRWALYQKSGIRELLYQMAGGEEGVLPDPGCTEQEFRDFVAAYDQVALLRPKDPTGRYHEVQFWHWMKAHPGFEATGITTIRDHDGIGRPAGVFTKRAAR